MPLDRIRWGILGCGDVTEVKSGPSVMNRGEASRVVACMRRDGALAADYARRHGISRHYDDAEALIADPEINAVYIATPPGSHLAYARQVAMAGKACYVEKPMARTFGECRAMVEAFRKANQPLLVAYYRRRLPRFVEAKRLIDTGHLGTVTGVQYEMARLHLPGHDHGWRTVPKTSGGGLFLDLGSHLLDLLDHLLGPLSHLNGAVLTHGEGTAPVEDAVAISFAQPGGIAGTARWNFAAGRRTDCITIEGTDGTLTMSCFGNEPLLLTPRDTPRDGKPRRIEKPHGPHVQEHLMTDAIAHLLGTGECPSTGDSAARTNAVMDTVLTSFYGDREAWLATLDD